MPIDAPQLPPAEWVVEGMREAVLVTEAAPLDRPGPRIVYVNPAFERLTGYSRREVIGHTPRMLQGPRTDRRRLETVRASLQRERPITTQITNYRKDGSEFLLQIDISPIRDGDGRLTHWLAIERDVSGRARAEQDLRESEARLRSIVETAVDGMIAIDEAGVVEMFNPAAERIFGYKAEEVLGHNVSMLMPSPDREEHDGHIARYLETGERRIIGIGREVAGLRKDGTVFPLDLAVGEVALERGRLFTGIARDITDRKRAEERLRRAYARNRALLHAIPDRIYRVREDGRCADVHADPDASSDGAESLRLSDVMPPRAAAECLRRVKETLRTGSQQAFDYSVHEGRVVRGFEARIAANGDDEATLMVRDMTERKQLHEQLLQAQKMEATGLLAGGVAHDFNNLLTAILGYAEMARTPGTTEPSVRDCIEHIERAAERASDLTRQLLAFARRQIIETQLVDLASLVASMGRLLRRLIPENIELEVRQERGLWTARVDPGQMEQVILNLAVNARDAMPDGGLLTIETSNVVLDEEYARHHVSVVPGEHVLLAVSDTGVGMTEEVRERIFEPFFTTKEVGKGTGLGLAVSYGIVKQLGGDIWVYSEPGRGTTVKVYVPRAVGSPDPGRERSAPRREVGTETVLLVEDEPTVRDISVTALRAHGYQVIAAPNGREALEAAAVYADTIDLLVTDVVMPQMGGTELAARLQATRPGLKVLYVSGYTDNSLGHQGELKPGMAFLPKPFSPNGLVARVRGVLDA
ncbi:MAG: PAS domain S-box protein [Chthonomonadales bacterium]|nr:PAS domain S-box protein [Chthonomonadales bacterium]